MGTATGTPHLCAEPGCPNIIDGPGRCPEHHRAGRSGTRGYGRAWRRVRDAYITAHPTCEMPGCLKPALDVHHRDGRHPTDPGANDWTNLAALCRAHHRTLTHHPDRDAELPPPETGGGIQSRKSKSRGEQAHRLAGPEIRPGPRGSR